MFRLGARRLLVALLALVLVSGAVAPALLTVGYGNARPGIAAGAEPGVAGAAPAATTPTENESIRHEDPDDVGEDGDLENVQDWLLGRISGRLEDSTIDISQGQYDAAEGVLDDQTREYLDQFIDVAGETEGETDDEAAETVNDTIEEQRDFARTRRNYSELYTEYLEAIENNDLERARRLGRQLADLERRLNRTGRNLTRNYRDIGNTTGVDTGEERRIINRTVRNVSEIQEAIRRDLFNDTRIVIEEYTANASVLDPIVVRGRVVTENGTPIPAGDIALDGVGKDVAVNETGHFRLRHRPVLLPRGETTLTLQYLPPPSSEYLGSTATFGTTIAGREPTLEVTGTLGRVGFGEEVEIGATLTVANRTIEGVPIEATIGGEPIASTVTANGTTNLSGMVPAAVDDGSRELRVSLAVTGRAIATTNATRTLRVEETTTWLTTGVAVLSPTRIRVRGELETFGRTPIPNQTVRVAIGGEMAGSATTDETGAFAVNLTVPDDVDVSEFEDRRVPVNATFAAPETNLKPVNEVGMVTIPSGSVVVGFLGVPWWAWAAFAVLCVAAGGYLVLTRREEQAAADPGGDGVDTSSADAELTAGDESREPDVAPSLLAIAMDHLEAGAADSATEAGYEAVRRRLGERLGIATGTHWELYRACQAAGWPDDRIESVRRLTEAYERAAFAPGSLSAETAREALATARDVLGDGEGDPTPGSD